MQAWNRFLVKLENKVNKVDGVKLKTDYLAKLADSNSEQEYQDNRKRLVTSPEWKANPKFQDYMLQHWLPEPTYRVGMPIRLLW